jgi:hypothetical protein
VLRRITKAGASSCTRTFLSLRYVRLNRHVPPIPALRLSCSDHRFPARSEQNFLRMVIPDLRIERLGERRADLTFPTFQEIAVKRRGFPGSDQ